MNSKFAKNTTEKVIHAAQVPSILIILLHQYISIFNFEHDLS